MTHQMNGVPPKFGGARHALTEEHQIASHKLPHAINFIAAQSGWLAALA